MKNKFRLIADKSKECGLILIFNQIPNPRAHRKLFSYAFSAATDNHKVKEIVDLKL